MNVHSFLALTTAFKGRVGLCAYECTCARAHFLLLHVLVCVCVCVCVRATCGVEAGGGVDAAVARAH